MISYMIPIEQKPSSAVAATHHQSNDLPPMIDAMKTATHGGSDHCDRKSIMKECSINSFVSDATTATPSYCSSAASTSLSDTQRTQKTKCLTNKQHGLKRVSFGSSKSSIIESTNPRTCITEKQHGSINSIDEMEVMTPLPKDDAQIEDERETVRVSFVQQSEPQEVVLPPPTDDRCCVDVYERYMMAAADATAMNGTNHMMVNAYRQESVDNGWDNPFRPGGDLSREADEIVELIKGGKPITPIGAGGGNVSPLPNDDQIDSTKTSTPIVESPPKKAAALNATATPKGGNRPAATKNGAVQNDAKQGGGGDGNLDVQRGNVESSQVEHVVIKKKPKCKCCVIQ